MTRKLVVGAAVAALGATMATSALAGVDKIGGSITINTAGTSAFKGKVKSQRRFCKRRRLVVVKRRTPGKASKDPIVGRDKTNRRGKYFVDLSHPVTGTFYARATRKIRIISGNGVVCRPLETTAIHID